jgi:hypothetical protein
MRVPWCKVLVIAIGTLVVLSIIVRVVAATTLH